MTGSASASGARATAGALIVAALAVLGSFNSSQISAELSARSPDPYQAHAAEDRFRGAKERLPPTATIAYISDLPLSEGGGAAFLTAQYALAPLFLVVAERGNTTEWAIGNFAHPGDFAARGAQFGFAIAQDLGNGVVIYRRAKP